MMKLIFQCLRRFIIILSGVRLSPLGTAATTGLLYQPQMIDPGSNSGRRGGKPATNRLKYGPAQYPTLQMVEL
jgi:hypothetical protein